MAASTNPAAQRPALLTLAQAIQSRDAALRRDDCGDWRIKGRCGHVYPVPGSLDRPGAEGVLLYVSPGSSRGWASTKRDFAFSELTQDGDDEGCFFLDRLPSAEEAVIIRRRLGIAKARCMTEEELARRRKWASDNSAVQIKFSSTPANSAPFTPKGLEGENSYPKPPFSAAGAR